MQSSKKKSPVWSHFTLLPGHRAKCNYCPATISTQNSNTSNVTALLRTQHVSAYLKMQADRGLTTAGQGQEQDQDAEEDAVNNENLEGQPSPSPSPSPSPTPSSTSGSRGTPSPAPFSPPASPAPTRTRPSSSAKRCSTYQESMEAYAPDSKATERFHRAVAHYVVTCQRPLNTVEKEGFKDMLKTFKPGYKVLTRRALTDKYIPQLGDQVKDVVRQLLSDAEFYSLTSDNWTSDADVPFTFLTAHFIDEAWENLFGVTLRCRASHVQHTGLVLKDFFGDEMNHWDLKKDKIPAVTTDNAEDYRLALELLEMPHMRCIGHTIQNGVTDIFELKVVKEAIAVVKTLFSWISTTSVWAAYEKFVKEKHGRKPLALPSTSKTRWWTELI
ncbi:uncharacterized protein LOC117654282 [Thrips palmi]|uniref:Uncharacterized protein LOC117654282 n=1 Tax=Thrips palmi TaxID=161013 RepID=A0A6P9AEG0_THRPL|nr:uncharacterized protein LOC117654282 [Thrips palmi]